MISYVQNFGAIIFYASERIKKFYIDLFNYAFQKIFDKYAIIEC